MFALDKEEGRIFTDIIRYKKRNDLSFEILTSNNVIYFQ
jgi:hypothetical protein